MEKKHTSVMYFVAEVCYSPHGIHQKYGKSLIAALRRQSSEFKASLVYRASLRTARDMQKNWTQKKICVCINMVLYRYMVNVWCVFKYGIIYIYIKCVICVNTVYIYIYTHVHVKCGVCVVCVLMQASCSRNMHLCTLGAHT